MKLPHEKACGICPLDTASSGDAVYTNRKNNTVETLWGTNKSPKQREMALHHVTSLGFASSLCFKMHLERNAWEKTSKRQLLVPDVASPAAVSWWCLLLLCWPDETLTTKSRILT